MTNQFEVRQVPPREALLKVLRDNVTHVGRLPPAKKLHSRVAKFDMFSNAMCSTEQGDLPIRLLCSPSLNLSYEERSSLFDEFAVTNAKLFRKFTNPIRIRRLPSAMSIYQGARACAGTTYALGNMVGSEFEVGPNKLIVYLPNGAYFGFSGKEIISATAPEIDGKMIGEFDISSLADARLYVRGELSNRIYRYVMKRGKVVQQLFSAYLISRSSSGWGELIGKEFDHVYKIKKSAVIVDGKVKVSITDLISVTDLEVLLFGNEDPIPSLYMLLVPRIMSPLWFRDYTRQWTQNGVFMADRTKVFQTLLATEFHPECTLNPAVQVL